MEKVQHHIVSLGNLLALDVERILSCEKHLKQVLPGWIHGVQSADLKQVLGQYLTHISHYERAVRPFLLQLPAASISVKDRVIKALIEDTNEKLGYCADPEIYDACLLAALQEIMHFKISIYGTAAAFFSALGNIEAADIFFVAEKEERRIDELLSLKAKNNINELAKAPLIK
jgi:ferritin-like metal-binding protein YciE